MRWHKHRIAGVRGPLAFYWSKGAAEIQPILTAQKPRVEVRYDVVVKGRSVGCFGSLAEAKRAA